MVTIYTHAHFTQSVGDFGIPEELSSWLKKKLQKRGGSPHGTESHATAAQPDYWALAVTSVMEGGSMNTHTGFQTGAFIHMDLTECNNKGLIHI